MTGTIFTGFSAQDAANWGRSTVRCKHNLSESGLFSDAALAKLIERYPEQLYDVSTMSGDRHDKSTWRYGRFGRLPGHDVLAAVRTGRLWINLRNVGTVDKHYGELLDAMFGEIEHRVPGLGATFRRKLGILVSSPGAQVFYHADIPGQSLWQIRGRKRVYVYPVKEPFLPREMLEDVVTNIREEEIPYEPWYDQFAEIYDLEPGEMLHWGLNGPHRVVNQDCLNVSLTTEHWTDDIRRHYAMNYANGVLRHMFDYKPRSRAISGPAFWMKAVFAAAWKYGGFQKVHQVDRAPDFHVSPNDPRGFVTTPKLGR